MTIDAFPFDDQATTETEYSKLFRELKSNGIIGDYGDTSFKVSVDGSGIRKLRVQSGSAIVRGFMAMSVDASDESVTLDIVSSGQRIDTVVLRLDPSNNDIYLTAVQGDSSAAPTLTQTDTGIWEFPLADVTVLASNSMSVVDRRKYTGMNTGVWASGLQPASPKKGQLGYNVTTGLFEFWNGTAWGGLPKPNSTATTGITAKTYGASISAQALQKKNGIVQVNFSVVLHTALANGNIGNAVVANIPAKYRPDAVSAGLTTGATGPALTAYCSNINGDVVVTATTGACAVGSTISFLGTWIGDDT